MVWKLLQDGKTITYVAKTLCIPRSTITSIKRRVELQGSMENIPIQGRKSIVSTRDYQKLEGLVKSHRRENLKDITDSFNENRERSVSKWTVQLYLHKNGLLDGYQKRNLSFEKLIGKKRRAFCREKRKLTVDNYWRKVNFSDESKIVVGQDSLVYI